MRVMFPLLGKEFHQFMIQIYLLLLIVGLDKTIAYGTKLEKTNIYVSNVLCNVFVHPFLYMRKWGYTPALVLYNYNIVQWLMLY